ncbi:hypothetical protein ACLOJK_021506 [Asimina triloba]
MEFELILTERVVNLSLVEVEGAEVIVIKDLPQKATKVERAQAWVEAKTDAYVVIKAEEAMEVLVVSPLRSVQAKPEPANMGDIEAKSDEVGEVLHWDLGGGIEIVHVNGIQKGEVGGGSVNWDVGAAKDTKDAIRDWEGCELCLGDDKGLLCDGGVFFKCWVVVTLILELSGIDHRGLDLLDLYYLLNVREGL